MYCVVFKSQHHLYHEGYWDFFSRLFNSSLGFDFLNPKALGAFQHLGGWWELQGCWLSLLPPHHPCAMEVEQFLGFRAQFVCSLWCARHCI